MNAAELAEKVLAMVNDPDHINRVAAQQAARTDPWRWYCRLCGETGENADRTIRNSEAYRHVGPDGPHGQRQHIADGEHGRLLHVWCY